ncbi:MAG: GlcNAc transferase [Planctomycetaceae bacterium]|nr:GlcNAc transferase [Planctomycetaceae bacterium]
MASKDTSTSSIVSLQNSMPLSGECVTFTGTLASMVHRDAMALVETYGGRAMHHVSGATTLLVVGEEGWPLEDNGEASQKLLQASQLVVDGENIRIISESDWLHLIGLNERREEIQRSYTPAMLSRLLNLPVGMIRRWARVGLIKPVRRICRLPYFDFREVSSAQRLAQLLDQGIGAEKLERSLCQLNSTLGGADRSLAQLNLLVQDEKLVMRDAHGVLNPRTGQRLLDFDSIGTPVRLAASGEPELLGDASDRPEEAGDDAGSDEDVPVTLSIAEARLRRDDRSMQEWTADEWFYEGCRLSEEAEFESAVNAFRNCLSLLATQQVLFHDTPAAVLSDNHFDLPDPADVHFHLADALYRCGRTEAAIERYHCAIEFAPDFIEAWTQLGCLLAEREYWLPAEEALLTAISIHDANPDALLHYAQLLEQTGRAGDALPYWKLYLQHDSRGPWADHARKQLESGQNSTAEIASVMAREDQISDL